MTAVGRPTMTQDTTAVAQRALARLLAETPGSPAGVDFRLLATFSPDYCSLGTKLLATDPDPARRRKVFAAAIKGRPDAKALAEAVFGADPEAAVLSSGLREEVAEGTIAFHSARAIAEETPERPAWVVPLYVARGTITELDGPPKRSGKTTLLNEVLAACVGLRSFLGAAGLRTGAVVLTEQKRSAVRAGLARAGLLDRDDLLFVYWHECKRAKVPFHEAVRQAADECLRRKWALLAVDTIGRWAGVSGDSENHSGTAMDAMEPIHEAAGDNLAVLITRHDRKSGGEVGESGRGSNAWTGEVDIVLQLARPEGNAPETQRVLSALSRFDETPDRVVIDLTPDGYVSLGDVRQAVSVSVRQTILEHLPAEVTDPVTQGWRYEQIAAVLPTDAQGKKPARATVDEVLKGLTATEHGPALVNAMKLPQRGAPAVYWLTPAGRAFLSSALREGVPEERKNGAPRSGIVPSGTTGVAEETIATLPSGSGIVPSGTLSLRAEERKTASAGRTNGRAH